ncbi:MAG: hypothetical protein ACI87E_004619 [Mariniblastus sp.]
MRACRLPPPFFYFAARPKNIVHKSLESDSADRIRPLETSTKRLLTLAIVMPTKIVAKILVTSLILISLSGCVQRRFIIRSQPEGAFVTIDRQPIGLTPLSVPWTYNGTREIQVEKDGYKTIKVQERFQPTWYETFPASLVTENFWPQEIRDERVMDFQLEPKTQVQENLLLERANDMRMNVNRGTISVPVR